MIRLGWVSGHLPPPSYLPSPYATCLLGVMVSNRLITRSVSTYFPSSQLFTPSLPQSGQYTIPSAGKMAMLTSSEGSRPELEDPWDTSPSGTLLVHQCTPCVTCSYTDSPCPSGVLPPRQTYRMAS